MAISLRAASGSAVASRSLASRRTVSCVRSSRTTAVVVRASVSPVNPPAGVTLPPKQPEVPPPMFGFVDWAEKMNSRAAMIGFFALLAVEGITGKGFLEVIGWKIGSGLGFEL